MTRLEDAFDDLIASYPRGDPDALLASARREVAAGPDRRRSRLALAAAAAVLAAAALATALIAFRDDPDAQVRTGPGPTTTLPAATTTAAPRVPAGTGAGYAVASVLGVTLRTGTDQTTGIGISRNPAASAYAIGTDLVVFQGTDADVDTTVPPIPPPATGAIWVWAKDQGTVRLPVDASADQAILLDAAVLDGSPTALVALRSGDTPDTARERLVLVDLDTRRIRPVIDIAAWEAGHQQARLLPDGDVVGLLSAEGRTSLVRWTAGANGPVWSVETDATANEAIAIRGDRAVLVDDPPPRSGSLRIRTIDLEGGDLGTPTTIGVGSDDLWCSDWYDDDELSCAHNGSAGAVDERGAWRGLETPTGAVVTPSR